LIKWLNCWNIRIEWSGLLEIDGWEEVVISKILIVLRFGWGWFDGVKIIRVDYVEVAEKVGRKNWGIGREGKLVEESWKY